MKKGILLLCSLFMYACLLAQGSRTGCLLPDNKVYTTTTAGLYKFNSNAGVVALSSGYCDWTPTGGITCTVCFDQNGQYNNGGNCSGGSGNVQTGVYNTFTMVLCPLDDYIPFLILASSVLGLIHLRKRINLMPI
ncbi:hypothetical protein EZ428_10980 [Pedobacter frigiditerrae]|uniref:PEP-CTERM protein-sorting domain-containing protein n=1 Tax=Pedobacter frigiditerrae TaxID=2530452 RepID=A0A4R0N1L5_9SPHI|nr:hypothetical protein [Pedobacter frigiditerrae]TCC92242.1 hypothetical protein EZ428_10980 [Pedobacter frigiditerrae]